MQQVKPNERYFLRENVTGTSHDGCLFRFLMESDRFVFFFDVEDTDIISPFQTDNEDVWEADAAEVFLSPDGNLKRYFELEVSPYGVRFFAAISNEDGIHFEVEKQTPAFTATAELTDAGYRVTIFLPYASLPGLDKKAMKMNAFRIDQKPDGTQLLYALSPTFCDRFHRPKYFLGVEE